MRHPVTVAIDGMSGAGKTTLADSLAQILDCNIIHMDNFFLPQDRKKPARLAQPGGNVHYERFAQEVLPGICSGKPFSYGKFDCSVGKVTQRIRVLPKPLYIVEGVYSLHSALAAAYDLKIFLEVQGETQLARIRARGGEPLLQRFITEWIPLENQYFAHMHIREHCDFIFQTE